MVRTAIVFDGKVVVRRGQPDAQTADTRLAVRAVRVARCRAVIASEVRPVVYGARALRPRPA